MGKKKQANSGLGRALIKDRFGDAKNRKFVGDKSMLHTTEVQDGYDWGRLNLQSVTEESSFQEFLSTAELAGTEFQAEKLNIKFVNPRNNIGLLSKDEMIAVKGVHQKHKELIKIPRRPAWDNKTTPDELQDKEKENFLEWRRGLSKLQEDDDVLLTPYEKNLEFWRQLWRVVERSDVIMQIVDARNPILFRCEDLEKYVKEVSENKMNMILINKADFLTEEQRQYWADYFTGVGIQVIFFSATLAADLNDAISEGDEEKEDVLGNEEESSEDEAQESIQKTEETATIESATPEKESIVKSIEALNHAIDETENQLKALTTNLASVIAANTEESLNSSKLLTREELIEFFRNCHSGLKVTDGVTTIGLVGYPNVGKSSTINALMTVKKVSVSATPGKTKHFQTLYLDKDILLCDCPGLVMPSFVFTKAEMVINGILPVDQMRDHVPPVNLVASLIPRHVIENKYGIMLPLPMDGEDETRPPTAEELLNSYGYNRGFMTANGQPDNPRSARYILKDYINGKLLYANAPPSIEQTVFHTFPEQQRTCSVNRIAPPREVRAAKPNRLTSDDLDKMFFRAGLVGAHSKGKLGKPSSIPINQRDGAQPETSGTNVVEKPWKKINKHENKKKKEKLRRVYAHLDQH